MSRQEASLDLLQEQVRGVCGAYCVFSAARAQEKAAPEEVNTEEVEVGLQYVL